MTGALLVVLAALAQAAQGPPSPERSALALSWSAPAGCPDEAAVRQQIGEHLGARTGEGIEAHAVVRAGRVGWQLRLQTRVGDREGERTLEHEDCTRLAEAAALIIALLVQDEAVAPPAAPPPPEPIPPPPPPPPAPVAHWGLGADVLLGWGQLPRFSEGGRVRAFMERAHLGAVARLAAWWPRSVDSPVLPGANARFWSIEFSAGACAHTSSDRSVGVQACGGAVLTRMHGAASGVSDPGQASAWLAGAFVEGSARLALGRHLGLRAFGEGKLQPSRPGFAIGSLGELYRPAPASVTAGLGLDERF